MTICPECGDSLGSRYHEVAHLSDVDAASLEELEAAEAILEKLEREGKRMEYIVDIYYQSRVELLIEASSPEEAKVKGRLKAGEYSSKAPSEFAHQILGRLKRWPEGDEVQSQGR